MYFLNSGALTFCQLRLAQRYGTMSLLSTNEFLNYSVRGFNLITSPAALTCVIAVIDHVNLYGKFLSKVQVISSRCCLFNETVSYTRQ